MTAHKRHRHSLFYPDNHVLGDDDLAHNAADIHVKNFKGIREHKIVSQWPDRIRHTLRELGIARIRLVVVRTNDYNLSNGPFPPFDQKGLHLDLVMTDDQVRNVRRWPLLGQVQDVVSDLFPGLAIAIQESISIPGHIYYHATTLPSSLVLLDLPEADYGMIDIEIEASMQYSIRGLTSADGRDVSFSKSDNERQEIGLFVADAAGNEDFLSYQGVRSVLGEHEDFQATAITFPAHHLWANASAITSVSPNSSFHSSIVTEIRGSPPRDDCDLHLTYTLPASVLVDPYQLAEMHADGEWLSTPRVYGEVDLELPVGAVASWGSVIDVVPKPSDTEVSLPIHVRYQPPKRENEVDVNGQMTLDIPWPQVYFACPVKERSTMRNPFLVYAPHIAMLFETPVEYDFAHVSSSGLGSSPLLMAPGLLDEVNIVQNGTVVAAIAGVAYLSYAMYRGWKRNNLRELKGKKRE